ncbi:hypothetical protein Tco_0928954 [Tanacetum coccineum]
MEILFKPTSNKLLVGSNTLSWKPCHGGSSKLNLPDHRYKRRCCSLIPAESDSLPHAHAQTTKTYYKHQGRLLESFQEDAKYEHVGQDTRSQGSKDDQDKQGKDLKISEQKTKSKDNDKGLRSKITKHEGTSLQHNNDQRFKNLTTKQSQQGAKYLNALVMMSKVSQCSGNDDYFPYVPAHNPLSTTNISIPNNVTPSDTLILQDINSHDEQPEFTIVDDHPVLNEHSDSKSVEDLRIVEDQVSTIIEPVSNVDPSPTIISSSAKVFINPPVLQDRWSKEKHIELVNILGGPQAEVTTRSRIRDSKAASAHECLYVNFLSKIEPKKLIKALKEEGWIIASKKN